MAERADDETCWIDDCRGVRFGDARECFAHLGDDARADALARLAPGADLDLRNTTLTPTHVHQLLTAVSQERAVESRPLLGRADFSGCHFAGDVGLLGGLEITGPASFAGAHFAGKVRFIGAVFGGPTDFTGARFDGLANFGSARFGGDVELAGTRFDEGVIFTGARFEAAEQLGPTYADVIELDRAQMGRAIVVDAKCRTISLMGTRLDGGGVLRLDGATVWLDGAVLSDVTTVVSSAFTDADSDSPPADGWSRPGLPEGSASIGSIRGVDASKLILSGVDLSACRFAAAYQLDQLRIEGRCRFGTTPAGVRVRFGRPPVWWWTRRQTIIEEHRWRGRRSRKTEGWTADYPERPMSPTGWKQPTHAERVAALYRQLRKAFEDAKNEPGAADFYYGEMEMRRLSPTTSRSERFILTLYWLFSGYGLRAGRAIAGLAVLVGATTWLLAARGFESAGATIENALRTALNAVVFRTSSEELTTTGAYVEMGARVAGPILLALAVLSVRNRVKR